MQFRILPVAVALLAVVVVVLAVDQPGETVDALHAKCGHHGRKHWIAENEELDEEAMKTAFPSNYEAMGWMKYKSGKCTYKKRYADCPGKHHWHHDEDHWDHHYGFARLHHWCTDSDQCCSHNCIAVRNASSSMHPRACCKWGEGAFNANCTTNHDCCSHNCGNTTVDGQKVCLEPMWSGGNW